MTPLLSEALQEAYASATTEDVIVDTLEIVAGTQHLYLCRGFAPITLQLEDGTVHEFLPVPFTFNLPGQDSTGAQTLNVGVENVDGTVASFIQSALLSNSQITVKYRSYLPNRVVQPAIGDTFNRTVLGSSVRTVVMPDGLEWMAENLSYSGSGVANTNPAFGRLYTWAEALALVPGSGWRVPSVDELRGLYTACGYPTGAFQVYAGAGAMKTNEPSYWYAPNTAAANAFGFRAMAGGYWNFAHAGQGYYGALWTSTAIDSTHAYTSVHRYDDANAGLAANSTHIHWSVRLVRAVPPNYPTPQNARPLVLTVTASELTLKGVTFSASVADFVNQPFPNAFYSFTSFPGLR